MSRQIGLEGRFDAGIGDLVVLVRSQGLGDTVSGYVKKIKDKKVKLSHTSPRNRLISRFFSGNRYYKLNDFDDYEILKPKI